MRSLLIKAWRPFSSILHGINCQIKAMLYCPKVTHSNFRIEWKERDHCSKTEHIEIKRGTGEIVNSHGKFKTIKGTYIINTCCRCGQKQKDFISW